MVSFTYESQRNRLNTGSRGDHKKTTTQRHNNTKEKNIMNTTTTTTEKQEIDFSIFQFPKLAQAVVDQMGGEESFLSSWEDIINHGISGGFSGFIYYSETVEFAKKHIRLIRELAKNQADDFGIGMLEMIKGFRCLNNDYSEDEIGECLWGEGNDNSDQILNALAWYAVEEICHEFSNSRE